VDGGDVGWDGDGIGIKWWGGVTMGPIFLPCRPLVQSSVRAVRPVPSRGVRRVVDGGR